MSGIKKGELNGDERAGDALKRGALGGASLLLASGRWLPISARLWLDRQLRRLSA